MNRFLERLDGAASTIVPLLYLLGLSLGTLAYFTGITADFNLAVGSALAFAAELHSFLQLRRTRASYGLYSRLAEDDPRRDVALRQLRINLAILAALVSFSAYNATSFAASTWRPTGGFLPIPVQIAIRGLIVPAFFLLAGFLSPLTQDAGALLADASHTMLHKTLRTTLRQWTRRVDRAAKRGLDLAPVAVALMRDAGDEDGARRVALIADGLNAAEGNGLYPTGGGSPVALPAQGYNPDLDGPDSAPDEADGASERQVGDGANRRPRRISAEARARRVWHPGMSVRQLAERAHIGRSAASKYARVFRERDEASRAASNEAIARAQ